MKVKSESEKVGLKLNIQKTNIMASSPITSWQRGGEAMETVTDFILGAPKSLWFMTAAMKLNDICSLEEKLWPTQSILKSRDITLPTKVHLVKAMVFPVVMYGCQSWTIKKAELRAIVAFELWCWRRLLRIPWTAMRSNQLILKEISPEYSLEGLMLKLKLQYFGPLMHRTDSLGKTLMLGTLKVGGEGNDRGWDGWMALLTQWTWVRINSELVMDREVWHAVVHGVAKSRTWLSDWTEVNHSFILSFFLVESVLREELPNHLVCAIFSGLLNLVCYYTFKSSWVLVSTALYPQICQFLWIQLYSICLEFPCTTAMSFSLFYFF